MARDVSKGLGPLLKKGGVCTDPATWTSEIDIRAFAEKTRSKHFVCYDKRGRVAKQLTSFIGAVHKSAPVLDVFIQQQPFVAALAWGTGRFLVQIVAADAEVGEKVGGALAEILPRIQCWNTEAETLSSLPEVRSALQALFGKIIVFLVHARAHFASRVRYLRSAFNTKFPDTLRDIESSTRVLEHTVRAETLRLTVKEISEQSVHRKYFSEHFQRVVHVEKVTTKLLTNQQDQMALYASNFSRNASPDAKLDDITDWLGKGVYQPDHVPEPTTDTCAWIYQHPRWKAWEASGFKKGLVITGIPGCGKSVLGRSIVDKWRTSSRRYILYHRFGGAAGGFSSHAAGFAVKALYDAVQSNLITQHKRFRSVLRTFTPLTNRWKDVCESPLRDLLVLLDTLFELVGPLVLLVDGLDECSTGMLDLLRFLGRAGERPQIQLIILSRDHLLSQDQLQNFVQIQVEMAHTNADIVRYIDEEIDKAPRLQTRKEIIRQSIIDQCQGIFLWASLILDMLKSVPFVKDQKAIMANLPDTLLGNYEHMVQINSASFTPRELQIQRETFLIVQGAKQALSAEEIYDCVLLDIESDSFDADARHAAPAEAAADIVRLCRPLLKVVSDNRVEFVHATAREYLLQGRATKSDSDLYLARKCLSKLSQSIYRSWKTSASLLRRHLLADTPYAHGHEEAYEGSVLYNYAVLHFQDHIRVLSEPPDDLLAKLARFLRGPEFVTWSEVLCDLSQHSDLGAHVLVFRQLLTWTNFLSPERRVEVPIEDFFETAHELLSQVLRDQSGDKLLQYLPLVRLGQYYNTSGQVRGEWQKAYEYKQSVVEGFRSILGPRSPVTLRFRTSLLQEYFWQKRFDEAYTGLCEVAQIQREVFDVDVSDLYHTLQLLACALHCMTRFEESLPIFEESATGLTKLLGDSSQMLLGTRYLQSLALEQLGRLDDAKDVLSDILAKWLDRGGEVDPLTLVVRTALGSVLRKQGKRRHAEQDFLAAYGGRKQLFAIDNNVCLDTAVQLALLYREDGNGVTATEVLDSVSDSKVYEDDFERYCQTQHIRALVMLDAGKYEAPKVSLLTLLQRATGEYRNLNNRELLWIRLTLASVMRQRGEDDQALLLFEGLVEATDSTPPLSPMSMTDLSDEPESPGQLQLAEQALQLVRQAKQDEASDLLRKNHLKWVRQQDFWVLAQGGPIPDTATIRPVVLDGSGVESASNDTQCAL